MSISFAFGSQRKCSFQWNMGLREATRHIVAGSLETLPVQSLGVDAGSEQPLELVSARWEEAQSVPGPTRPSQCHM